MRQEVTWGSGVDITWVEKIDSGYQVWVEQLSSHAYKDREYQPRLVETISPAEFERREKKTAEKRAANEKWKADRAARPDSFHCPCCDNPVADYTGSEEFNGERLCYNCLSGMFE